uniref:Ubiquitin-like protease family profile domain-containing protein n=1 Tax=Setaria italica TaxID=4555 RepID=K4A1Z4_SETIT
MTLLMKPTILMILLSDEQNDFNIHFYQEVIADCKKFKMLKNKIKSILTNQLNMQKFVKKLKYVITRFCVTDFAKVIKKLTPNQRQVIEKYGFGSLLHFDKSRLVDHKSSDIVIDGRIISLTKESVHNILGIPLSWRPFPTDISHGKSVILKNFKKQSMPKKVLSDEDTFIRFILIALNSFLCSNASNASVTPSQKHLGMFDDITNCKVFDWSGYVLSWLLRHIKTFKKGKTKAGKEPGTLGAVMYLAHVDFGVYGFRPILDFVDTYYAKRPHLLNSTSSLSDDSEFMEMIDLISICRAIEIHSFSCVSRVNLNTTSISSLPDNIFHTFKKPLQHASNTDSRLKNMFWKFANSLLNILMNLLLLLPKFLIVLYTFSLIKNKLIELSKSCKSILHLLQSRLTNHFFAPSGYPKEHEMYNIKYCASDSSFRTPIQRVDPDFPQLESSFEKPSRYQPYLSRDSSTSGNNFKTAKAKISVSNSELKNYKALFSLASSQYNNEDVVHLEKVRSTFYLYMKPTSNPDISKSHFFFCKYWFNEAVLARAFKRSSMHRPLHHSNNVSLFSDTLSQPLVRVFVNIKDCNFVFLDPLHHEDYDFLEIVRSRMFASFVQYWDRYVKVNMNFDEYDIVFPDVPDQPLDNTHDFFYHV